MNNKNAALIVIAFVSLFYFVAGAHCRPIEVLFKHREYLAHQAKTCDLNERERNQQRNMKLQQRNYFVFDERIRLVKMFSEMSQKNLADWKKGANEIIDEFFVLCRYRFGVGTDTILVNILIETLGDLPEEKDRDVIYYLEKVPYLYLSNYRAKILAKSRKNNGINRFRNLIAVVDPPDAIKKELLASDSLSLGLRARLGDKKSERELIECVDGYGSAKCNSGYYANFINELFLCGSNDCLRGALELFVNFKPIMRRMPNGEFSSITDRANQRRAAFIIGFRKYHPELALLHKEYEDVYRHAIRYKMPDSWDVVTQYMERFVEWGNKEYGTDFKLKDSYLFGEQLSDEGYRMRELWPSERK